MGNVEERDWESYKRLAQVDFKCLENEIYKITSNSANVTKNKPVPEEYKYKCKREEDVKTVLKKLFNIIAPTEDGCCDYIGECVGKRTKECKKCKGYWFTTDETFESYYEMWKEWKADKKGMDPDDSDCVSNPFLRAVYYSLWGKRIKLGEYICINTKKEVVPTQEKTNIYQNGFARFRTSFLFPKILWGGDTMNTLASYEAAINDSTADKDALSRKCHQLGNFVLVPAYFNQWRGWNTWIKDQMDLSLFILEDNQKNKKDDCYFSFEKSFFKYWGKGDAKTAGWNIVKEAFESWTGSNFAKYINMFFLWDYVEPNDDKTEYLVKDVKTGSTIEIVKICDENVGQYIANANRYIERRGIFMAAMLEIAVEFEEEKNEELKKKDEDNIWHVSGIYKYIAKNVFLNDDKAYSGYYSDYKEVIMTIKGAIEKAVKDKLILEETKNEIDGILDKAEKLIEDVR